jgi:hypothetical protein
VVNPRFGLEFIGKRTPIDDVIETARVLDSISAKLVLSEVYETMYDIFDHDQYGAHRPLGVVAHHTKENYNDYGPLYHMAYKYRLHDIRRNFGYTFDEFLQLPREFITVLFEVCAHEATKTNKTVNDVVDSLGLGGK